MVSLEQPRLGVHSAYEKVTNLPYYQRREQTWAYYVRIIVKALMLFLQ